MQTVTYGCQKRKTTSSGLRQVLEMSFHIVGSSIYIWIKLWKLRKKDMFISNNCFIRLLAHSFFSEGHLDKCLVIVQGQYGSGLVWQWPSREESKMSACCTHVSSRLVLFRLVCRLVTPAEFKIKTDCQHKNRSHKIHSAL